MQMINAKLKEAAAAHRTGRSQDAETLAAEALAMARQSNDPLLVAYTLRHTADIQAQLGFFDQSATEIAEAIRIYREHASGHALDLANACASRRSTQSAAHTPRGTKPKPSTPPSMCKPASTERSTISSIYPLRWEDPHER
jgi:hypothetical protein